MQSYKYIIISYLKIVVLMVYLLLSKLRANYYKICSFLFYYLSRLNIFFYRVNTIG